MAGCRAGLGTVLRVRRRAQGLRRRCCAQGLSLVDDADVEAAARLKLADREKGVLVPGPFDLGRRAVALLALGFGRGAKGDLRVPYSPAIKA
jgi:hypothetical protein